MRVPSDRAFGKYFVTLGSEVQGSEVQGSRFWISMMRPLAARCWLLAKMLKKMK